MCIYVRNVIWFVFYCYADNIAENKSLKKINLVTDFTVPHLVHILNIKFIYVCKNLHSIQALLSSQICNTDILMEEWIVDVEEMKNNLTVSLENLLKIRFEKLCKNIHEYFSHIAFEWLLKHGRSQEFFEGWRFKILVTSCNVMSNLRILIISRTLYVMIVRSATVGSRSQVLTMRVTDIGSVA